MVFVQQVAQQIFTREKHIFFKYITNEKGFSNNNVVCACFCTGWRLRWLNIMQVVFGDDVQRQAQERKENQQQLQSTRQQQKERLNL